MVAGAYDQWRATRMFAQEQDVNQTLSEITTVGLPISVSQ
jgi:hypothetical protein